MYSTPEVFGAAKAYRESTLLIYSGVRFCELDNHPRPPVLPTVLLTVPSIRHGSFRFFGTQR
jgi:hypothetical protein